MVSIGAASWLPPARSCCFSHGGPGEPKRPRAYTSASQSCKEKGESRRQPTPPSSAVPAGRELALSRESRSWSNLQKKRRKSL